MRRGDVSVGLLVSIIAILAFLAVVLVIVWPVLREQLFGAGEKGQCQFDVTLFSMAKQLSAGTLNPEIDCKMSRKTVSMASLDAVQDKAMKRVKAYHGVSVGEPLVSAVVAGAAVGLPGYAEAARQYPDNLAGYRRWALDSVLAKEMVECYDRGVGLIGQRFDLDALFKSPFEAGEVMCMLCTRVLLDTETVGYFNDIGYSQMPIGSFLAAETEKGVPMLQYVKQNIPSHWHGTLEYASYRIGDPIAVMFIVATEKREGEWKNRIGGSVALRPYTAKLTSDLGIDMVSSIWGYEFNREKMRCKHIIGV